MKILHVITRLVDGGAQRNTLATARAQARRGHQVTLAAGPETGREGSLWQQASESGCELVTVRNLVREVEPGRDVAALLTLLLLMRRRRYEVVHTHTSKAGMLGRLAARLAGVPVVIHTPHGHVFWGYFPAWKSRFFTLLERLAAGLADRLVMLTQGCLEDHVRAGVGRPEQRVVIPSGVELEAFLAVERGGIPDPEAPRLGCVARLVPVKGQSDLLRAFSLVVKEFPRASLTLVGDGPQREELISLAATLGVADRVSLPGYLRNVTDQLRGWDLFVLPSHNEGMGRAAVEAMASGLPVVASCVGGLPDLVLPGITGELVAPRDPEALAKALVEVLRYPDRMMDMGSRGREHSRNYSQERMIILLEHLYRDAVSSSALGRAVW